MYEVYIKYNDGFEFKRNFEILGEAKSYFHNVDVQDIDLCTLCEITTEGNENNEPTEIARKEARKKPAAAPPAPPAESG